MQQLQYNYTPGAVSSMSPANNPWAGAAGSASRLGQRTDESQQRTGSAFAGDDGTPARSRPKRMSLVDTSRHGDVRFSAMERLAATLERKGASAASLFRKLDTDKNGSLTWFEFVEALRELNCGLTETEELEICQTVDEDKNGTIMYNEFVHALGLKGGYSTQNNTYRPSAPEDVGAYGLAPRCAADAVLEKIASKTFCKSKTIAKVFRSFDKDGNGMLSMDEVRLGLQNIGVNLDEDELEILGEMFDPNGTGEIYYRDFAFRLGAAPTAGKTFQPIVPEDVSKYRFTVTHGKHSLLGQIAQSVELRATNVRKVFRQLDRDGNGQLDMNELRIGLRHLGFDLNDEQFAQIVRLVDVDGDGQITLQEFQSRITNTMEQGNYTFTPTPQTQATRQKYGMTMLRKDDLLWKVASKVEAKRKHLTSVFRSFDKDHDGEINYTEFREGLTQLEIYLTDEEFYELIKKIDRSGDGFITYKEFATTMGATRNDSEVMDAPVTIGGFDVSGGGGGGGAGGFGEISSAGALRRQELLARQAESRERMQSGQHIESFPRGHVLHSIQAACRSRGKCLWRVFKYHDHDEDGRLTMAQLQWAIRDVGVDLPERDLAELFMRFAGDDGKLEYTSITNIVQPEMPSPMRATPAATSRPATAGRGDSTPGRASMEGLKYRRQSEMTTPGRAAVRPASEYTNDYLIAAGTVLDHATPGNPNPQVSAPLPVTPAELDVDSGVSTHQTKCDVLYRVAMHVDSKSLSTAQVLKAFRRHDHDNDGHLTTEQVRLGISDLGLALTSQQAELLTKRFSPSVVHFVRLVDLRRLAAAVRSV